MLVAKIPTTVVTGFLGAGKTTLVNHLLKSTQPMPIGVVVNEFGEMGIDGQLIVTDEKAIIEINNGCVCCTVRSDLVKSVLQLLNHPSHLPERLIVETSGLADPAPVLQTFLADPDFRERVELESGIVVVDAQHAPDQLRDDIAREQVVFSDRIVINKTELVAPSDVITLASTLRALNPTATLNFVTRSAVSIEKLLGQRSFSIDHLLAVEPGLLTDNGHDHEHDSSITSCAFHLSGELDGAGFNRWVNQLVQSQGTTLMRMKGVLNVSG